MPDAPQPAPLDLIEHHESGGQNVPNYRYDKTHTAGGYWQITNSTWRAAAPKAGVDIAKYPDALSSPREVQKAVAEKLFAEHGYAPWAPFNPALAKAVGWRGPVYTAEAGGKITSPKMATAAIPAGARALTAEDDPTRQPSRLARAVSPAPEAPGVPLSVAPATPAAPAAPAPLQLQPAAPIQAPNLHTGYGDALSSIMAGRRRPLASMFG